MMHRRILLLALFLCGVLANVLFAWVPADVAQKPALVGQVTYEGTPPKPRDLSPLVRQDREYCLKKPLVDETWTIGANKGVANVVVWLRPADGKPFDIPENVRKRKEPVTIAAPHCRFEPHVAVLFPTYFDQATKRQVETGAKIRVLNSAPIAYSVIMRGNPLFNPAISRVLAPGKDLTFAAHAGRSRTKGGEDLVTVRCDIHGWMKAYVWAFDHPYAAVSQAGAADDKSFGSFTLRDVPVDREVDIVYWHEALRKAHVLQKKVKLTKGVNRIAIEITQPKE